MISLSIPPDKQVSQITKMLNDEYGSASQIKSSKTRSSVQTAITSTRESKQSEGFFSSGLFFV